MKFLIKVLFLLLGLSAFAQPEFNLNDRCNKAYQEILSLKFDRAEEYLNAERFAFPQNLYVDYLENYIDFLSVVISEDASLFQLRENNKSERIDRIKKLDKKSPYRNYLLGNIHLQWAVARLKFKEYFTAAYEINKAYRLLTENKTDFPGFIPNNITLGVLHIMIGLVPDKYLWLLDIINMEGDIEMGKEELKLVLYNSMENEEYAYLKNEVLFYLAFVELNIYPDEKELKFLLSQLENEENDNLLLSYLHINILMRTGNNELVIKKFKQLPDLRPYYQFSYLDYLEAESHLRKLDVKVAEKKYKSFLKAFNGQNYIKDAHRKLAWIALLNKDTLQYQELMIKLQDLGQNNVGQDIDATREANENKLPNTELIRSRLLFDGGYYQRSDSMLNMLSLSVLTKDDSLELRYRKARIAHKLENYQTAKRYYRETIKTGKESPRYFAGNAALKLGEIYESEMAMIKAEEYYRLCLDLDFEEFEAGIHSMARAGLKRVTE